MTFGTVKSERHKRDCRITFRFITATCRSIIAHITIATCSRPCRAHSGCNKAAVSNQFNLISSVIRIDVCVRVELAAIHGAKLVETGRKHSKGIIPVRTHDTFLGDINFKVQFQTLIIIIIIIIIIIMSTFV